MNSDFLRFQSFGEDPMQEVVNISGHQQFSNPSTNSGKESHNDNMSEMMLKIGRDMSKQSKKPVSGSKLAFSHQVSGVHDN